MDGYSIGGIGMSEANIVMKQPQKLLKANEVADLLNISQKLICKNVMTRPKSLIILFNVFHTPPTEELDRRIII